MTALPSNAAIGDEFTIGSLQFRCDEVGPPATWVPVQSHVTQIEAEPEAETPLDLEGAKAAALQAINAVAAEHLARWVTPGKDSIYIQKQNEAIACLDDNSPTQPSAHPVTGEAVDSYPNLKAMIGVWIKDTGNLEADLKTAALYVLGKRTDVKLAMARIESVSGFAKRGVAMARSHSEVSAVLQSLEWPK